MKYVKSTPLIGLSLIFLLLTLTACTQIHANGIVAITPLPKNRVPTATATPMLSPPTAVTPTPELTTTVTVAQPTSTSTPTPMSNNLALGQAAAIAAATDVVIQPTPRNRIVFEQNGPIPIKFDEFYDGFNLRKGLILSDKLVSLDSLDVTMEGYMAPPLKADLDYFMLTKIRLAFCPFCSSAADWPDDIALVYMVNGTATVTQQPVRVTGRMEIGQSMDAETGMVSIVRIYAEKVELLH